MTNQIAKRRWIFIFATTLISAAVVTVGGLSMKRQQPKKQQERKRVTELPLVISHVPRLHVEDVSVKNPGTPDATAVIKIRNDSNLAVMAVEISTKNGGDSAAVNQDGLEDSDNPGVAIPPGGTIALEMPFINMIPDAPLVVSAAFFADGTEDGDKWSLDAIKALRAHYQELRKARKGGPNK